MISHDPDLARVAGVSGLVNSLPFVELRQIGLGCGQTFVSLAEALDAFPDARFNIDVKENAAIGPTAAAIVASNAQHRVLITSFSERRRRRTVSILPGVASSASSPRIAVAVIAARLGLSPVIRRVLRGLVAVQVPQRAGALRITTPRFIAAMHRAGVEVHVWTVNDETEMTELLDLGVDGLVTDRTDLAVRLIAARS